MYEFAYQKPGSIDEAARALSADAEAKALAGGMTFIPVLKQRLARPDDHRGPRQGWAGRHQRVR